MSVENLKSILLISLIASSLLLTLALWNHQPNSIVTSDDEEVIDPKIEDGQHLTKREVLMPTQIVLHGDQDNPSGLKDRSAEIQLYENILSMSLYNFKTVNFTEEQWHQDNLHRLELVFPTEIPSESIYDLFMVDPEVDIPSQTFNRIELLLDYDRQDYQLVFRNDREGENTSVIGANLQNYNQAIELIERRFDQEDNIEFTTFESSRGAAIYLPNQFKESILLFSYKELSIDPFKNLLFNNPSIVRGASDMGGHTTFIDGTRELATRSDHIAFTNYTNEQNQTEEEIPLYQLLDQVQSFINNHNGFTFEEPFSYFLSDLSRNSSNRAAVVKYTLAYQGIPIFQLDKISSISVVWNNQDVYEYSHPLIVLSEQRSADRMPTSLMTPEEVIEVLKSELYRNSAIYDVVLGYQMRQGMGGQSQVYELTPTWFVKGIHGWQTLAMPTEEMGGDNNAMGSN
ncbi:YycH family regulatory protein [Amphibacillus sediminis]|uniref:YycH family regulatory protein n=1 Tax=Amphibacillus sediminis TaxID=360185 RepID=UPI00082F2240|nr:two-component system activity regulator YycH [Amphibacillus sediminis]